MVDITPVFSKMIRAKGLGVVDMKPRYALFYLAKLKEGSEIKLNEDELYSYSWFKRSDLDNITFWMPFYKDMLEKVLPF